MVGGKLVGAATSADHQPHGATMMLRPLAATVAATLVAATICAPPAAGQFGSGMQFINTSTLAVDVLVDNKVVLADYPPRSTSGSHGVLYGAHAIRVIAGADTSAMTHRFTGGQHYHVYVLPGGAIHIKEDERTTRSPSTGWSVCYLLNVSRSPISVRLLDALDSNKDLGSLADTLMFGETSEYQSFRQGEHNFVVTSPADPTMYQTFYLDTAKNFNLREDPFVLIVSNTADSSGIMMSTLSGHYQFAYEDLAITTSVAAEELPPTFTLRGNYPNPFNPSTTITFDLSVHAAAHVVVYDVLGRAVLTTPPQQLPPGDQAITVDAAALPSGMYVYQLIAQAGGTPSVRYGRMTLLK